jgi:hypothetical protein
MANDTGKTRGMKKATLVQVNAAFEVAKGVFGENVSLITVPSDKDLNLIDTVMLVKDGAVVAKTAGSSFLECVKIGCVLAGAKVVPSE